MKPYALIAAVIAVLASMASAASLFVGPDARSGMVIETPQHGIEIKWGGGS